PTLASRRLRSSGSVRSASRGSPSGARASARVLCATICLAMSSAWRCVSSTVPRGSWARCTTRVVATTTRVSRGMARASFDLRPQRMLDAVAVQLVVKGFEADAQDLGGPRLVIPHRGQRLEDHVALYLLELHPHREWRARAGLLDATRAGRFAGEVRGGDELARAGDHGALQRVAELADIAGPVVRDQEAQRSLVHPADLPLVLAVELLHEGLDEERDVLAPGAQRGQGEREDVEPVVQILAKAAVLEAARGLLVGGGEHAHVHLDLRAAADPLERPVLEDPEELGLERRAHLGDLVEEEGA